MNYPFHIISNNHITAEIALPDKNNAYYRGRRFEWGANILHMTCHNRIIFSPWTAYISPENHESIAGPMEEFSAGWDDKQGGPGLDKAQTGDPWLKIGVGVLEKTASDPFRFSEIHPLIEGGKWTWQAGEDHISFTHELDYPARGWAYTYVKSITLKDSGFTLDHCFTNRGKEKQDFMQYNHNFFTLENCPAGPDWEINFPCEIAPLTPFEFYRIEGKSISYHKPLTKGGIMTYITGDFGSGGYRFSVRNKRDNIQVDVQSDSPLELLKFWSCKTSVCPEPYIRKQCNPNETVHWSIHYAIKTD